MGTPLFPNAIDSRDVANMLGLSRRYTVNHIVKRPDFPAPFINVSQRVRYWDRAQVLRWMQSGSPHIRRTRTA